MSSPVRDNTIDSRRMRRGNAWWLIQITTAAIPAPGTESCKSVSPVTSWGEVVAGLEPPCKYECVKADLQSCAVIKWSLNEGPRLTNDDKYSGKLFGFFSSQSHSVPVPCHVFSLAEMNLQPFCASLTLLLAALHLLSSWERSRDLELTSVWYSESGCVVYLHGKAAPGIG